MKIIHTASQVPVPAEGQVFRWGGKVYIRMHPVCVRDDRTYNAVDLTSGRAESFDFGEPIDGVYPSAEIRLGTIVK
jgi:hypothetical protein